MDNWLLTNFLSDIPAPLSFYTALEITIFLRHFSVSGEIFPFPSAGDPDGNKCEKYAQFLV